MTQQEICAEVYRLLECGDSLGAKSRVESTALDPYFLAQIGWSAIEFSDTTLFRWLLDRARPVLNLPWSLKPDESLLVQWFDYAATKGNLAAVQMLVKNYGADINCPATIGLGPVIGHAVASNNVALVEWMLDHGANPNSTAHGCLACYGLMTARAQQEPANGQAVGRERRVDQRPQRLWPIAPELRFDGRLARGDRLSAIGRCPGTLANPRRATSAPSTARRKFHATICASIWGVCQTHSQRMQPNPVRRRYTCSNRKMGGSWQLKGCRIDR